MKRLHAGDNAEFAKARNVGCRNRFNVLDAPAAILLVIAFFCVLIAIQSHAHAIIPNGMRKELETALVQFGNGGIVVRRLPKRLAF